ncbi:MAG: FliO/MopB family protein [Hyphococcus sp.]
MNAMFSIEIMRILFGLVAVIGLIAASAYLARKLGLAAVSGGLSKMRRLSIVETIAIDARRRAVIIKCDDAEHLVILGANGETVVARDVQQTQTEETGVGAGPAFTAAFEEASDRLRAPVRNAA